MKTRVFAVAFIGAMAAMSASATDVQMYSTTVCRFSIALMWINRALRRLR